MSRRARLALFAIGVALFGIVLLRGVFVLPRSGHGIGRYAELLNYVTVEERHATDVVAAITFDYRGVDTLIEEMILFTSVVAVATLLRPSAERDEEARDSSEDRARDRELPRSSDAVRAFAAALTGLTVVFGLYVASHGQISPGGGFQGGVVLATAPLVVYLADEARSFARITPEWLVELAESVGAGGFLVVGFAGAIVGGSFLRNVLPLGRPGDVFSAGTIFVLNLSVALEVAAGIVLVLRTFVVDLLAPERSEESPS